MAAAARAAARVRAKARARGKAKARERARARVARERARAATEPSLRSYLSPRAVQLSAATRLYSERVCLHQTNAPMLSRICIARLLCGFSTCPTFCNLRSVAASPSAVLATLRRRPRERLSGHRGRPCGGPCGAVAPVRRRRRRAARAWASPSPRARRACTSCPCTGRCPRRANPRPNPVSCLPHACPDPGTPVFCRDRRAGL